MGHFVRAREGEFEPTVMSVALLIFYGRQLYAIRERKEKPQFGKPAGSLSFPWETMESEEKDRATLARLLSEEVDCSGKIRFTSPEPVTHGYFVGHFQAGDKVEIVSARAYWCRLIGHPNPSGYRGSHEGTEVEAVGFVYPRELFERGREGVVPIALAAIQAVNAAERATWAMS